MPNITIVSQQLTQIVAGQLTGVHAADALREAHRVKSALNAQCQALMAQIRATEDYMIYGDSGRPEREYYR